MENPNMGDIDNADIFEHFTNILSGRRSPVEKR